MWSLQTETDDMSHLTEFRSPPSPESVAAVWRPGACIAAFTATAGTAAVADSTDVASGVTGPREAFSDSLEADSAAASSTGVVTNSSDASAAAVSSMLLATSASKDGSCMGAASAAVCCSNTRPPKIGG